MNIPDWVDAREYQQQAVSNWMTAGGIGVLQMATGTGKTVTALLTASQVSQKVDGEMALIIAVPYQHLVDQWAEDVRDFGQNPILVYESRQNWQARLESELAEFDLGVRNELVAITTHATFASENFQRVLSRISRDQFMLIADEVHHLGAPHLKAALPDAIPLRLGLSATPERFYDDEGTEELFEYFGGIVYQYGLGEAIRNGALCEYYYIPHVIELTEDESDEYLKLSKKIARLISRTGEDLGDADLQDNKDLQFLLFRRARLVGTAKRKLDRLVKLIEQEEEVKHTLVYCGDGTVEGKVASRTRRHVDAATTTLRTDLGLRARRFTADESRAERQSLLQRFSDGEIDALVAIRCLDEGVDVPATRTAYMLASSSNPRQFVQRRGRILRNHPGKNHAIIHDFVVAPPMEVRSNPTSDKTLFTTERNLVKRELERVNLFAESARNHPDSDIPGIPTDAGAIGELKRGFNLQQM
ncbi:DEAD/DEAH box helicase family protein [Halalkalirubrum salinum]|uniref:DEAD/DEAH box helicase family protein n=1 Tax=Halalkalirubrum salinum TaxID=2563889 RepID=UPI0010FB1AC0|nr:DEAD/DEAH box helicase family protein [Halalkalirubrum salinum]